MYCVGHMNLISQIHECLKRYCFQHVKINQNVRNHFNKMALQLEEETQKHIQELNKKIAILTPPEIPASKKGSGTREEGIVGRYTLAARQRNREINYSAASRQLQDLYTQMMDGQEVKVNRNKKKSKLKSRLTSKGAGSGQRKGQIWTL